MKSENVFVTSDAQMDRLLQSIQPDAKEFFQDYFYGMENFEQMAMLLDCRAPQTKKEAAIFCLFEEGVDVDDMIDIVTLAKGIAFKQLIPSELIAVMRSEDHEELYGDDEDMYPRFLSQHEQRQNRKTN